MKLYILFFIIALSTCLTPVKQSIWMDVDTGVDDAIALISVALSDKL